MEWSAQVDGYCERLGPGFWAEPVNALTNLAFIVAAIWAWRRGEGELPVRVLAAILFAIGVGSGLFHTLGRGGGCGADPNLHPDLYLSGK